jgi:hypothetical protein
MRFLRFFAILTILCLSPSGELAAYLLKDSGYSVNAIQKDYPSDNEEEVEQKVKDIMVADFARLLVSPIQPCILSLEIAIHLPKYHPDTQTPPPNN